MKSLFTNLLILVFCTSLSAQPSHRDFVFPTGITQNDFLKDEIIIKLKPEYRQFASENEIKIPSITDELNAIGVSVIKKKFPHHADGLLETRQWPIKKQAVHRATVAILRASASA